VQDSLASPALLKQIESQSWPSPKASVRPRCGIAGVHAGGRGRQKAFRRFFPQFDNQMPAIHARIFQSIDGVILQLVVARSMPAIKTSVEVAVPIRFMRSPS
jgi:hypothetical protein